MKLKSQIIAVALLLLCSSRLNAQTHKTDGLTPWYGGVKIGIPFGVSTFTSFGADKTRVGFNGGVYGGYNINNLFSAELSISFGNICMSAHDNVSYWLGEDGNHYFAPVSGMNGHNYSELYSSVMMQNYGVKFNVNLLQLHPITANSRWTLHTSPMMSAIVTNATIKQFSNDAKVMSGTTNVHFGIGGELSVGYRITNNLSANIYSGVTYLTGARMDGMPEYLYRNNYVWDSGIKLTWRFGKKKAKKSRIHTTPAAVLIPAIPIIEKAKPVTKPIVKPVEVKEEMKMDTIEQAEIILPVEPIEPKADTVAVEKAEELITSIYFEQDQTFLPTLEHEKLNSLLELMNSNPDLVIVITGWANTSGSVKSNLRVSHSRAQNVGWWLTKSGIPYSRLKMSGKGIDLSADDMDKARRVDITKQIKEQKDEK